MVVKFWVHTWSQSHSVAQFRDTHSSSAFGGRREFKAADMDGFTRVQTKGPWHCLGRCHCCGVNIKKKKSIRRMVSDSCALVDSCRTSGSQALLGVCFTGPYQVEQREGETIVPQWYHQSYHPPPLSLCGVLCFYLASVRNNTEMFCGKSCWDSFHS